MPTKNYPVRLEHIRQPDNGFHKAQAVNRAVHRSKGELLIFSDGDCLAARNFVDEHLQRFRPGSYTVGGHIRLSPKYTNGLRTADVLDGRFERQGKLAERLNLWATQAQSLYYIATARRRRPKIHGLNFSVDRAAFYDINGYDNTYRNCGREDSDLRNRMQVGGIKPRSMWHRAGGRVYHLEHPRHSTRLLWEEVAAYYNRPDLAAEAPSGLREVTGL